MIQHDTTIWSFIMMQSKIYNTAMFHFHFSASCCFKSDYPHTPSIELHACGGFSNWIPVGAPKTSSASLPGSTWFHIASVSSFDLPTYGRSKSLEPLSFLIKCFLSFPEKCQDLQDFLESIWKFENHGLKPHSSRTFKGQCLERDCPTITTISSAMTLMSSILLSYMMSLD